MIPTDCDETAHAAMFLAIVASRCRIAMRLAVSTPCCSLHGTTPSGDSHWLSLSDLKFLFILIFGSAFYAQVRGMAIVSSMSNLQDYKPPVLPSPIP